MCTPLIALALTAAGTAASAAGARKAQKAQAGAREAERTRQKGFQSEADARAAENLASTNKGATDSGMKKAEDERKAASDAAVAEVRAPVEATGANLAGDGSAAKLVAGETATQAAKGLGYAIQQGAAKAKLAGFNDVGFENALMNARTNQDIARIANFAKGSSDVLPVELEAAAQKGQGLRTLGSVLSTAGTVAGIGVGSGWFGAGTPATGIAPGFNAAGASVPSMGVGAGPYVPGWTTQPLTSLPQAGSFSIGDILKKAASNNYVLR
jgi:hypothetical protein